MTSHKTFKQRVRARMDKTGESYTAARAHLIGRAGTAPRSDRASSEPAVGPGRAAADRSPAVQPPPGGEHTASAGAPPTNGAPAGSAGPTGAPVPSAADRRTTGTMRDRVTDDSVREHTGRDYAGWFALLDGWNGTARTHTGLAAWLGREQGVPAWWAQTVTVAYEQERGMRVPGQKKDGFAVSVSKTVHAPVERLFAAFVEEGERGRWLHDHDLSVRTSTEPRRLTADFDRATRISANFTAKDGGRSTVAFEHTKLADAETAARTKAFWRHRLGQLKVVLEEHGDRP
jgi:uncharacterized protein YndB with AHSA1/START domain